MCLLLRHSMVDGRGKIELVWTNSPGSVAALPVLAKKLAPLPRLKCQMPSFRMQRQLISVSSGENLGGRTFSMVKLIETKCHEINTCKVKELSSLE